MAILINNVKYLSQSEQVEKNQDDIKELKKDVARRMVFAYDGVSSTEIPKEDVTGWENVREGSIVIDKDGNARTVLAVGELILYLTDYVYNLGVRGEKGEQGIQGPKGPEGPKGEIIVNSWNTATKTLALGDVDKLFLCSYTGNQMLTIPTNTSVEFPIGTIVTFLLTSDYKVTFSGASGVTLTSMDDLVDLATLYGMASLIKIDTNVWQLVGVLEW